MQDIYASNYVEELFDKMSGSYKRMNYISSFGFSSIWRRQCVAKVELKEAQTVVDLMTGMGECWSPILKRAPRDVKLIGLDFSGGMLKHAQRRIKKFPKHRIEALHQDLFHNTLEDKTADCVVSGFGSRTFSHNQLDGLAQEIERILKPNGVFSLIEISTPNNKLLNALYLFYLKKVIPVLGRIFLGNPETYKMLGIYTEKFGNSKAALEIFRKYHFEVRYESYFFGCATGISGRKLEKAEVQQGVEH